AHRSAASVEQARLPGERLAVADHPDDIPAALADAIAAHHHHVARVPVDLGEVAAQPPGGGTGVQLGLDDDAAAHDVQPAREAQERGDLRLAAAGLGDLGPGQLRLYLCRHRHAFDPATSVALPVVGCHRRCPAGAGERPGPATTSVTLSPEQK